MIRTASLLVRHLLSVAAVRTSMFLSRTSATTIDAASGTASSSACRRTMSPPHAVSPATPKRERRLSSLLGHLRPQPAAAASAGTATPPPPATPKLLVIHGKGCEERGKTPAIIKSHGPHTMGDYTTHITRWAAEQAVDVAVFHSTEASECTAALTAALSDGVTGVSFNPGAWTGGGEGSAEIFEAIDALVAAGVPVIETHISNPSVLVASKVSPHCRGTVYGFGQHSYV